MKTFTTSLLVNRLLTSLFTLTLFLFAGHVVALTSNQTIIITGKPVNTNTYTTNTLGIEYASLAASATDKSVFINWVTAAEQNNSHFEVERSLDLKTFKTVAMVLDGFAVTGTTGKSYKFKEAAGEIKKGKTVYYRLKQIDTDNQVHYSTVMAVQMNTNVTVLPVTQSSNLTSATNNAIVSGITALGIN